MIYREGGLLMASTQAMMQVVLYDPYKFLRAIRCCRENEQYKYGFMAAAYGDECKRMFIDIYQKAKLVLSSNQLDRDNLQFALEIEQAIKKIQESPEGPKGKDGFFLNVQEQINYHEGMLSDVGDNHHRFMWKLEECDMVDQLYRIAEECNPSIKILSFGTPKESEVYKSAIVERLCCNAHDDITAIKQCAEKGLEIQSSLFFALIESANSYVAVKPERKTTSIGFLPESAN